MEMTKRLKEVFRENFKARMDELNLKQKDVAEKMHVTQAFVSQLVNGRREPDLDTVESAAKAVKLSPYALLQENALSAIDS